MKKRDNDRLDQIFESLEFPGENPVEVREYLEKLSIAETMKTEIRKTVGRNPWYWGMFGFLQVIFLVASGSGLFNLEVLYTMPPVLQHILYVFLGTTLLLTCGGIVFTLDTTMTERNLQDILVFAGRSIRSRK